MLTLAHYENKISLVVLIGFFLTACSNVGGTTEVEEIPIETQTIRFPVIYRYDPIPMEWVIQTEPSTPTPTGLTVVESVVEQESPEEAIRSYWDKVSRGEFASAWNYLSPGFQANRHDDDYNDYLMGYQDMNLCSITVKEIRPVHIGEVSAVLTVRVRYLAGSNCTLSKHQLDHYLVLNQTNNTWLIDDVIPRHKDVTDRDIAQVRTIQEQAAGGEIDREEAEKKMLDIAIDIGDAGFTWIVRHVPVYDSDRESWMSFDNFARDMTNDPDSGLDPDSRFAQDPVGTTVDLFFRNPDPATMMDWFGFGDW